MNCQRIQDLILTDYVDGQMGIGQKELLDQHLSYCPNCQDYLLSIKKEVIGPFFNVPIVYPDTVLWARIKQAIGEEQDEQVEKAVIPDFWERIRNAVHIPRPAFALASIVTMIFMVGMSGQLFFNNQLVKVNGQDQMAYLSSLIDEPADVSGNAGNDAPSPIEKYFL